MSINPLRTMKSIVCEQDPKQWGDTPLFDPESGVTVLQPLEGTAGNWVGAPSVVYDDAGTFYMYYRVRRPRPLRGYEVRIARSSDGRNFQDVWTLSKEHLGTTSIERAALIRGFDGLYRMYLSYVDPADGRWRIDLLTASRPEQFDAAKRTKVMTAADLANCEAVKDPVVYKVGPSYWMFFSVVSTPANITSEQQVKLHETNDVYTTGLTQSFTGLAVSSDGVNFQYRGPVLECGNGWDAYTTRITSILYNSPVFTVFYDGAASVDENYEERTGVAISFDLRSFEKLGNGPLIVSPHGQGSVRYVEALSVADETYYYYEYCRADGAHEIRLCVI